MIEEYLRTIKALQAEKSPLDDNISNDLTEYGGLRQRPTMKVLFKRSAEIWKTLSPAVKKKDIHTATEASIFKFRVGILH